MNVKIINYTICIMNLIYKYILALMHTNLIGVEDDGLLCVELLHHLHGDAVDGRLEVGLLRVHHHPHVHLLGGLKQNTTLNEDLKPRD